MDFEKEELLLENNTQHFVICLIKYFITSLQHLVPIITNFGENYPTLFLALVVIFTTYITWKLLANFCSILKNLFFFYLIIIGVTIYIRGFEKVAFTDIPYCWDRMTGKDNIFQSNEFKYLAHHAKRSGQKIKNLFD